MIAVKHLISATSAMLVMVGWFATMAEACTMKVTVTNNYATGVNNPDVDPQAFSIKVKFVALGSTYKTKTLHFGESTSYDFPWGTSWQEVHVRGINDGVSEYLVQEAGCKQEIDKYSAWQRFYAKSNGVFRPWCHFCDNSDTEATTKCPIFPSSWKSMIPPLPPRPPSFKPFPTPKLSGGPGAERVDLIAISSYTTLLVSDRNV